MAEGVDVIDLGARDADLAPQAAAVKRCKELDILLVYDNAYSEIAFDDCVPPNFHGCARRRRNRAR